MIQDKSIIYLLILCLMIAYSILRPLVSGERIGIWSPVTFVSITLAYYIIIPSFTDLSMWGANEVEKQDLFFLTADLFYLSFLISYRLSSPKVFRRWNRIFINENVQIISLVLFAIAIVCYIPFRGFRTSISSDDVTVMADRTGLVSYFIDLISLFVASCCLSLVSLIHKKRFTNYLVFFVVLYFSLVFYIVGGFRYRIVILFIALATVYHLYPSPRRINLTLLVPIAVVLYLGFAVMDSSRQYGRGIDLEVAKSISIKDASKGAEENQSVCCFSIVVTDVYSRFGYRAGIEPIISALLMPIPRAVIPWKPQAEYIHNAEIRAGASGGAAFLVFTEAYISFGILGVVLYGILIGWLSKKFWKNYLENKDSLGAIVLLALFDGFCYVWISRGYMAAAFNIIIYYVILPFWISSLLNSFSKRV